MESEKFFFSYAVPYRSNPNSYVSQSLSQALHLAIAAKKGLQKKHPTIPFYIALRVTAKRTTRGKMHYLVVTAQNPAK